MARIPDQQIQVELTDIISLMNQIYSRDISVYEDSFLDATIRQRLLATSLLHSNSYSAFLQANPEEAILLSKALTNNHSQFFRDPLSYSLLEQVVLPAIIRDNSQSESSEIRLWSVACAGGEEAYSLAILLAELEEASRLKTPAYIFATDISESKLNDARSGLYNSEDLKKTQSRYIDKYFMSSGSAFIVKSSLKKWISFSYYDLLDKGSLCPPESIYGDFDLILCCNLLFYYKAEVRRFILNKLMNCLASGGYLLTGEVENSMVAEMSELRAVTPWAPIYQKHNAPG